MNFKAFIAAFLAAGGTETEARRIKSKKPLGVRFDYTPSKVKGGKFGGWPGDAKRRGRVKYRAKLKLRKAVWAEARKKNRVRYNAIKARKFLQPIVDEVIKRGY